MPSPPPLPPPKWVCLWFCGWSAVIGTLRQARAFSNIQEDSRNPARVLRRALSCLLGDLPQGPLVSFATQVSEVDRRWERLLHPLPKCGPPQTA